MCWRDVVSTSIYTDISDDDTHISAFSYVWWNSNRHLQTWLVWHQLTGAIATQLSLHFSFLLYLNQLLTASWAFDTRPVGTSYQILSSSRVPKLDTLADMERYSGHEKQGNVADWSERKDNERFFWHPRCPTCLHTSWLLMILRLRMHIDHNICEYQPRTSSMKVERNHCQKQYRAPFFSISLFVLPPNFLYSALTCKELDAAKKPHSIIWGSSAIQLLLSLVPAWMSLLVYRCVFAPFFFLFHLYFLFHLKACLKAEKLDVRASRR